MVAPSSTLTVEKNVLSGGDDAAARDGRPGCRRGVSAGADGAPAAANARSVTVAIPRRRLLIRRPAVGGGLYSIMDAP